MKPGLRVWDSRVFGTLGVKGLGLSWDFRGLGPRASEVEARAISGVSISGVFGISGL